MYNFEVRCNTFRASRPRISSAEVIDIIFLVCIDKMLRRRIHSVIVHYVKQQSFGSLSYRLCLRPCLSP